MVQELVAPNLELGANGGYLLSIKEATLRSQFTTMTVLSTTTYTISYSYGSPSGNDPKGNGNGLLLWQGQEPVYGPGRKPAATTVPTTTPSGEPTWSLENGMQDLNYVVAYCTDGSAQTVVATGRINPDGTAGDTFSSTISIAAINTGSAVVNYSFPPGYSPSTFGNRLGLYEGQVGAYDVPDGGEMTTFPRDVNSGAVAINHPFLRSTWYTIVYFAGARAQDAAGFIRFQTA